MFIDIVAKPSAKKNEYKGFIDGRFIISVKEPPKNGLANRAIVDFLSEKLNITTEEVVVVSGLKSKYKRIKIDSNLTIQDVLEALQK